jgi:hypothetical protein
MSEVMLNRLVPLWDCLARSAQDVGCSTDEDRDVFATRARSEGLPFISDGLAGLGRILLDGARKGFVTKEEFSKTRFALKEGSTLPKFLYSAWSRIFTDDGIGIGCHFDGDNESRVLTRWDSAIDAEVAVRWLRQLTIVFAKLQLPHSNKLVQDTADRFIANERDLAEVQGRLWSTQYANETRLPHLGESEQRLTDVLLRARRLIHKLLCNVDVRDICPKHGSGASACRTRPWERYDRIHFDPVINRIWPWLEFAAAGKEHCSQLLSSDFITDGYPKIARGVFVPKDYRGPRLISCEPATSMYYQQGLMTLLVTHLEQHPDTSGFVNFTNQSINQVLAREGSITRKLATLDLKDASDRLSWDLVVLLWPKHWYDALSAVRSKVTQIELPNKRSIRVPLRKHAPMGSAVCFPVMALTIWALIKAAQVTTRRTNAWIYGDDIVVASQDAPAVIDLLESVSLAVNRSKSFSGASPFRESCGKEYWNGSDVTPVYCRYNPSDNDSETASLCSFSNNFVKLRGTSACYDLVSCVHAMTGVPIVGIPETRNGAWDPDSDVWILPELGNAMAAEATVRTGANPLPHLLFGCWSLCQRHTMRWRPAVSSRDGTNFQKKLYRVRRPYPVDITIRPESWGYVLRSSLIGGDLGFTNATALARRVKYKYAWVALD